MAALGAVLDDLKVIRHLHVGLHGWVALRSRASKGGVESSSTQMLGLASRLRVWAGVSLFKL
jgi:hypothetical protein